MILLQFLKPLSDFALYFALVGSILSFGTVVQPSLLPAMLLAFVFLLCYMRREKEKQLLPLALLILLVPFVKGWADLLLYGFAVYYLFGECKSQHFGINRLAFASGFYSHILFLPPIVVVGILFGFTDTVESYTLPFMLLYFSASILLMRMLRAEEETLNSKPFIQSNLKTLVLTLGTAFLLSSQAALTVMKQMLNLFYFEILMPILNTFLALLLYILTKLAWLGEFFFTREVVYSDDTAGDIIYGIEMEYEEVVVVETPEWLKVLFFASMVALLFYIAYRIFKKMKGEKLRNTKAYSTTKVSLASPAAKKGFTLPRRKTNSEKVRETYVDFMEHCISKGIVIPPWMDSSQLLRNYGESVPANNLRHLYLEARYSHHDITKEDTKNAKTFLSELKKTKKES